MFLIVTYSYVSDHIGVYDVFHVTGAIPAHPCSPTYVYIAYLTLSSHTEVCTSKNKYIQVTEG